ncbi:hypothetical protein HPB47_019781, partial [Ixodes persulcatus]
NDDVGDVLRGFWELESIGIADRPCRKTEVHNEVLTEFNETIKKVEGRYEPKGVLGLLRRRDKNTLAVPIEKVLNFVTGRRPTTLPSKSLDKIGESTKGELTRRWRHRQKVMDSFWRRWKKEYLLQLRSAHQSTETQVNSLKDGDVVLVHEEKALRIQWRVGRIEGVQRGRDGHVRSCLVRLPNGTILRRPVQLLYPLELAIHGDLRSDFGLRGPRVSRPFLPGRRAPFDDLQLRARHSGGGGGPLSVSTSGKIWQQRTINQKLRGLRAHSEDVTGEEPL